MSPFYWERHPYGPFVTLIAVAATYLEPENYELDSFNAPAKLQDDEPFDADVSTRLKALPELPTGL